MNLRLVKKNANKVPSNINPKIPALLLVSNGEGTSLANQNGSILQRNFVSDQPNVKVIYMDVPHDLYHYQNHEVVSRIENFLKSN